MYIYIYIHFVHVYIYIDRSIDIQVFQFLDFNYLGMHIILLAERRHLPLQAVRLPHPQAYYRNARDCHPDKHPGNEVMRAKFQEAEWVALIRVFFMCSQ